jgi:hypothetical protein
MPKKEFLMTLGDRLPESGESPDVALKDRLSQKKKAELDRQDELERAEHETKMAELERKRKEAAANTSKLEDKADNPFQVKGQINVGNIDLQQEREETRRQATEAQAAMAEQMERQRQENALLREQLSEQRLETVKNTLLTQLNQQNKQLTDLINSQANRTSIVDQIKAMKATANELGLVDGNAGSGAAVQVELKRLEFELEDRRHQHTIEIERLHDERAYKTRQLEIEEKKIEAEIEEKRKSREQLAQAPIMIGQVLAKAMMSGGEPANVISSAAAGHIEAPEGEAGELECPGCKETMSFGPTQKLAVCPGCSSRFTVTRFKSGSQPSPIAEEEG